MDGRWYREGQTVNNGYTIGPRDAKTGQLSLMYNGGSIPISMAGSSPLPMPEVPTAQKIVMLGSKAYSDKDLERLQELNKDGELDQDVERAKNAVTEYVTDPTIQLMFGRYKEMEKRRLDDAMSRMRTIISELPDAPIDYQ
jgi:hypothetical protein